MQDDRDFEWYVERGRKYRESIQEWHNLGKTEEQIKEEQEHRKKPQSPQTYNDPTGFIIYLIVMAVGVVFVDRWLIWIAATLIYFGRKG